MAETVSVIGLGKLGGPLAACLAVKGLDVIGVDVNPKKVETMERSQALNFGCGRNPLDIG